MKYSYFVCYTLLIMVCVFGLATPVLAASSSRESILDKLSLKLYCTFNSNDACYDRPVASMPTTQTATVRQAASKATPTPSIVYVSSSPAATKQASQVVDRQPIINQTIGLSKEETIGLIRQYAAGTTTIINQNTYTTSGGTIGTIQGPDISGLQTQISSLSTTLASSTSWRSNGSSLYYSAGNVGVGTSTPNTALSVVGTTTISGALTVTSGNGVVLVGTNNSSDGGVSQVLYGQSNQASGSQFGCGNVTVGAYNTLNGFCDSVFGYGNTVRSGDGYINAIGNFNTVNGYQSQAFGANNTASSTGGRDLAYGFANTVTGGNSSPAGAFGYQNTVTATNAFAFGANVLNSASNSIQIGLSNVAKATILSTGEFLAPFFTATSTTATSTFAGNLSVSGNLNFNGAFMQNGAPFIGSQWSASGSNIYYNMGNVGIGTTSPLYKLHVGSSTLSGVVARFENSAGTCDVNPTTSSLSCSSDLRLKKNIDTLSSSSTLAKLMQLRSVTYNWLKENDSAQKHAGFIAQEVEANFPDLVSTDPDSGLKSVGYSGFIPYLAQGIAGIGH